MQRKRLEILRAALIEHAKNPGNLKFNLVSWYKVPRKYEESDPFEAVTGARLGENFCGTSACAMGLAATIPEFKRAGLHLEGGWCPDVCYKDSGDGFEAAEKFFGLSMDDAAELFSPSGYVWSDRKNPLAVADKITALLEVTA